MLINSVTYYKCLCLSRIYHNPDLPNFFLQAYRIVLGIFCLYNCIINNWLYLPEYLDIFLINYIFLLSKRYFHSKMKRKYSDVYIL